MAQLYANQFIKPAAMMKTETPSAILQNQAILSFSLERWNQVWRSRHHIMSELARSNKVLFASSPYQIRDAFRNFSDADADETGVSKISSNLHAYIPPRWLPIVFRYPRIDRLISNLRNWHIARALKSLGMRQPIVYIWHPAFAEMANAFDDALVVYHCYDEYTSFDAKSGESEVQEKQEKALLKRANIVFTVSDKVRERRLAFNPNIYTINNGVNYGLFCKAQHPITVIPKDISVIPHPIIGLVTTLTSITDLGLLREVFQRRPDWSFVFIGLEETPDHLTNEALRTLLLLPNIHIIGRRTLQEIPGYLKGCDVCALPWLLNELSLSGSPLKLYEYLASGKPVVSTPLHHLLHLGKAIAFASNANQWIAAIEAALRGDGPGTVGDRQSIARDNTWEKKVAFISEKIVAELAKRQVP